MKNKKDLMWTIAKIMFLVVLNSATIIMLILNIIPVNVEVMINGANHSIEMSYWDCITSKSTYEMLGSIMGGAGGKLETLSGYLPEYHWYNRFLVYLFMILGGIASWFFVSALWREGRADKRAKEAAIQSAKQTETILEKLTKKEDKEIAKILKE